MKEVLLENPIHESDSICVLSKTSDNESPIVLAVDLLTDVLRPNC